MESHEQEDSENESTNNQETRTIRVTGRNPDYAYMFSSWMNDSDGKKSYRPVDQSREKDETNYKQLRNKMEQRKNKSTVMWA